MPQNVQLGQNRVFSRLLFCGYYFWVLVGPCPFCFYWGQKLIIRKTVYKKRDTKFFLLASTKKNMELSVLKWWRRKLESGVLFNRPELMKKGLDYIGELPWPDEVSLRALRLDFVRSCPDAPDMTKMRFARLFRAASLVSSSRLRDTSLKKENGKVFMYTMGTFYHIGKLKN